MALLAARSPKLRQVLRDAKDAGHAYLIIDGTLIPIDRVAADRPFFSGKHRRHGMNMQVIASPDGDIVWVSGPLPGAVHDLTAARIWGIVRELAASGLLVLGDKGYHGEACIRTPYKGRNKPAAQKDANRAHARLRGPGERANAQLKSWRILRKLRCCPWRAGQLAKAGPRPSDTRNRRMKDARDPCGMVLITCQRRVSLTSGVRSRLAECVPSAPSSIPVRTRPVPQNERVFEPSGQCEGAIEPQVRLAAGAN